MEKRRRKKQNRGGRVVVVWLWRLLSARPPGPPRTSCLPAAATQEPVTLLKPGGRDFHLKKKKRGEILGEATS